MHAKKAEDRIHLVALFVALATMSIGLSVNGCGIFTLTPASPSSGGGGSAGGAPGVQTCAAPQQYIGEGGPEGLLYMNHLPEPDVVAQDWGKTHIIKGIHDYVYGYGKVPKGWSECPYTLGEAETRVMNGDGCDQLCFSLAPDCEAACVEFHDNAKDMPAKKDNEYIKSLDKIPCPTQLTSSTKYVVYSWQYCYQYVPLCLDECGSCTWPKTVHHVASAGETMWRCSCPGRMLDKQDDELCRPSLEGKARAVDACETSCRKKINECRDDSEEAFIYKHGVLSDAAIKSAEKKCKNKFKGCWKPCDSAEKKVAGFFDYAVSGNVGKFKKSLAFINKQLDSVRISDETGKTPLHHAAENGHLAIVKILIEEGAAIWVQGHHGTTGWYFSPDLQGQTAVDLAQVNGHTDVVEYLQSLPGP